MYLPPGAEFPCDKFFERLNGTKNLILCGDLNCKSKAWYSKTNNPNDGDVTISWKSGYRAPGDGSLVGIWRPSKK